MSWIGKWRNQYGSILEITDEADNKIAGKFRTALDDSGFFGQEIAVVGVHYGDCIGVVGAGVSPAGDTAPAEGTPARSKKLNWWRAMTTNADTFERVS